MGRSMGYLAIGDNRVLIRDGDRIRLRFNDGAEPRNNPEIEVIFRQFGD